MNYEKISGQVSYLGSICRFLFPFREKLKKKKGLLTTKTGQPNGRTVFIKFRLNKKYKEPRNKCNKVPRYEKV